MRRAEKRWAEARVVEKSWGRGREEVKRVERWEEMKNFESC